jgi:hypothetical protein
MNNGVFQLDWASIGDAILYAIVAGVVTMFVSLVSQGNFNVFTADWTQIGEQAVNIGFYAGVLALGKNFFSSNTGSLLGVGPAVFPTQPQSNAVQQG